MHIGKFNSGSYKYIRLQNIREMLVYANSITNRLQYIVGFIRKELGIEGLRLTASKDDFLSFQGPKINYSDAKIGQDEFWMKPHSLLFETGIRPQAVECFNANDQRAFFRTEGDFPFDIFSASFYLLSRYEEYLPHQKDMYGRYAHENSLAHKEDFLHLPLINIWLRDFGKKIQTKFPSLIVQSSFAFFPTYDIDEAYSFKHKGWKRSTGAAIKNLLKGNFTEFKLRRRVLKGTAPDPFDAYEWMDDVHHQFQLKPRYFFLAARKTGKYDRNILSGVAAMKALIFRHADKYEIGVHPSWQSGDAPDLIKKEKEIIEEAAGLEIISSRQHFIRFTLPQTFRYLIDAGIREDFSMGYGSINGFRASVASLFYWYDLEKEQISQLLLHPFCYMEANSFYEQRFTPLQALEEMRHYYREVRAVNGKLITIWHNTFLGTAEKFLGWREVYVEFLKEVSI